MTQKLTPEQIALDEWLEQGLAEELAKEVSIKSQAGSVPPGAPQADDSHPEKGENPPPATAQSQQNAGATIEENAQSTGLADDGPDSSANNEANPKGRTKSVPSARPQLSRVPQFPSEGERPCYRVYFQDQKIGNQVYKADVYLHSIEGQNHHTYSVDQWLCAPLVVSATTANGEDSNYGRLLEFISKRGERKKWSMPMALLAGDGTEISKYLYEEGLDIAHPFRKKIPDYISSAVIDKFLGCATHTGWHSPRTFVLPDSVIGQDDVWFQSDEKTAAYAKAGQMENWQQLVATRARGNPFLMFGLSFAFCGPLLQRLGIDGVGIHFYGDTTVGKTTVLIAGGSVWGGCSYLRSWRSTANGIEGIGVQHTDTLLLLDEIAEIIAKELDEAAYFLINGHGKNRADRHGQARAAARWRVPVLSSGEQSIRTKLGAITESCG